MKDHERVERAEQILGYQFQDRELALRALTHPSAVERHAVQDSYERLEFLGDAILGAVVSKDLYELYPGMDEGKLSRLKVWLVSGDMLSQVAGELGVADLIVMGTSEQGTEARGMRSALENVYESLVGALYLDGGYEPTAAFVQRTLAPHYTPDIAAQPLNPKSRLQVVAQRDLHCSPTYKQVGEEGPAHSPTFTAVALVDNVRVGRGKGHTKKEAEAAAAQNALDRIAETGNPHDLFHHPLDGAE